MAKRFKKVLFGCNRTAVEREIEHLNIEFEEEYGMLMEELKRLGAEKEALKQKIEGIDSEIYSVRDIEPEIGKMLAKAHFDVSCELYNSIKKFKLLEKERIQSINEKKIKCSELDTNISLMMDNVQSIATM